MLPSLSIAHGGVGGIAHRRGRNIPEANPLTLLEWDPSQTESNASQCRSTADLVPV